MSGENEKNIIYEYLKVCSKIAEMVCSDDPANEHEMKLLKTRFKVLKPLIDQVKGVIA